jgi:hypothetical protein
MQTTMLRPSALSRRFDHSCLLGHFVLGHSLPVEPAGWRRRQMDGWSLLTEPRLPVQALLDSDGAEIGWLLGHALDIESEALVACALRTPLHRDSAEAGREFEDWLYTFGGRFAAVLLHPKPMLYPDAGGSLPVFFGGELQCAASSPFLLCPAEGTVPDSPLVEVFSVLESDGCFTLGTSSHAGAGFLLPNHVLDLARWEQSRVWPTSPFAADDVESVVERIATTMEKTIASVARAGFPNVGLTAGGDCRTLVACSRGLLDRVRFFTVAFPDELGTIDVAAAPALARRFGLRHKVLPWREPSIADVELFAYRTGCMVGEARGRRAAPSYDQLGDGEVYISSVGSEVSRRVGQHRFDSSTTPLQSETLLSRFGFGLHPDLISRTNDWLAALPEGFSRLDTLTLFFAEMYDYVWASPLTMAYPEACSFTLYPYMHRSILDAVLRLPAKYRLSGRLREDLILARWAELMDVPINRPSFRIAARRAARKSARLVRAGFSWRAWNRLVRRTLQR